MANIHQMLYDYLMIILQRMVNSMALLGGSKLDSLRNRRETLLVLLPNNYVVGNKSRNLIPCCVVYKRKREKISTPLKLASPKTNETYTSGYPITY